MDIKEQLNIIFDPDISLSEAPTFMACGQACNGLLGGGSDIQSTSGMIKGALVGAALGVATGGIASAPLAVGGAMVGRNMPVNSLQKYCRAKCALDKATKAKDQAKALKAKAKLRSAEASIMGWIQKWKTKNPYKAKAMFKAFKMLKGKRF